MSLLLTSSIRFLWFSDYCLLLPALCDYDYMASTSSTGPDLRRRLVFCDHCKQRLSAKVYRVHRKLYYDQDSEQWLKKCCDDLPGEV